MGHKIGSICSTPLEFQYCTMGHKPFEGPIQELHRPEIPRALMIWLALRLHMSKACGRMRRDSWVDEPGFRMADVGTLLALDEGFGDTVLRSCSRSGRGVYPRALM